MCTPAQHSSGRTLTDQNLRLWSSWAILGPGKRFYFAGDTGYFAGMKTIGDRLGPFDLQRFCPRYEAFAESVPIIRRLCPFDENDTVSSLARVKGMVSA